MNLNKLLYYQSVDKFFMLFLWTTHFVDMPTQMKSAKRTMMGRHITVCASHIIQRRMYRRKSLQHRKQNRNIERQEMRSEEITRVLFAYFWRHWCAWRAECLVCEEKNNRNQIGGQILRTNTEHNLTLLSLLGLNSHLFRFFISFNDYYHKRLCTQKINFLLFFKKKRNKLTC